tara:strand:+ start:133507 stop:134940 length:1434 start_codon:yes stop_codon:yes gene_type:complete
MNDSRRYDFRQKFAPPRCCRRKRDVPIALLRVASLLSACFAVNLVSQACNAARPNVVLIMADDLGYGDLGCYGSEINPTPNIDNLASGGLRFTDFHSSGPMCTPTRAATLTGRYQQRFGAMFDTAISGVSQHDQGLPHRAVTIAEVLKAEGYATACFGKWHLGYQPPWLPTAQGFDFFRGLGSGDGDYHTHIDRSGREDWWRQNELEPETGYTTDLLTKHSVDFIENHHDQPFFLYVPHLAIHFPWQGPQDPPHRQKGQDYLKDKFGVVPDRSDVSGHVRAMIKSLDHSVGEIVSALEKWNLRDNTLVIFTSDNGGYVSYAGGFQKISSNGPLRGQKTELYEGGHRVPMIISWPGKIASAITNQTAHSTDLFPTIANLCQAETAGLQLDGVDLTSLIFDGSAIAKRTLFWRARQAMAVRSGPWKLYGKGGPLELFNLDQDLGETTNLADHKPDLVQKLSRQWDRWESDVNQSAENEN